MCDTVTHQLTAQFIFLPSRLIKRNSPPASCCLQQSRQRHANVAGLAVGVQTGEKKGKNLGLLSVQDFPFELFCAFFPLSALFSVLLGFFVFNSMHVVVSRQRSHCGWIMPSIWASVSESTALLRSVSNVLFFLFVTTRTTCNLPSYVVVWRRMKKVRKQREKKLQPICDNNNRLFSMTVPLKKNTHTSEIFIKRFAAVCSV